MSVRSNATGNITRNQTLTGTTFSVFGWFKVNAYPGTPTYGSLFGVASAVVAVDATVLYGFQQGDGIGYGQLTDIMCFTFRLAPLASGFAEALTGNNTGWAFYAITCDGTNVRFYIRTATQNGLTLLLTDPLPSTPARFDIFNDAAAEQFPDCDYANFTVMDGIALSARQLLSQSNTLKPIVYLGGSITLDYRGLNAVAAATDLSGNGNNGTVNNTLLTSRNMPPASGVYAASGQT